MSKSDLFYFTIAQSKLGNIRDLVYLSCMIIHRKPITIHLHGGNFRRAYKSMNPFHKWLNRIVFKKISRGIVLGESLIEMFDDLLPREAIKIVPNFAENSSLISREEFDTRCKNLDTKKEFSILFLSNMIESKGYLDVLKSIAHLDQSSRRICNFKFAGMFYTDEERNNFIKEVDDLGLAKCVDYVGVVTGFDKKSLIMDSDIFILPTYYQNEGQPISIIEALGNGLGIITTKHAGIVDIVNEQNAKFVNAKNPSDIAMKICNYINNIALLKRHIVSNRERFEKVYQEKHYIANVASVLSESDS